MSPFYIYGQLNLIPSLKGQCQLISSHLFITKIVFCNSRILMSSILVLDLILKKAHFQNHRIRVVGHARVNMRDTQSRFYLRALGFVKIFFADKLFRERF